MKYAAKIFKQTAIFLVWTIEAVMHPIQFAKNIWDCLHDLAVDKYNEIQNERKAK